MFIRLSVEPLDVVLSSTLRAEERKQYEIQKQVDLAKAYELETEVRERKEREERREIARQRKETIIKPAPIKQYKPLEILRSDKQLTTPRSPKFSKH